MAVTIHRQQTRNAFGDVVSEIDGRAWSLANSDDTWAKAERTRLGYPTNLASLTTPQKQALIDAYTTSYTYNTMGKLTQKTDPQTGYTLANGFIKQDRPITQWTYDLNGNVIAVRDANGHLNTQAQFYSFGEGVAYQEWHADGGMKRDRHDVFGNLRRTTEALTSSISKITDFTYDKL